MYAACTCENSKIDHDTLHDLLYKTNTMQKWPKLIECGIQQSIGDEDFFGISNICKKHFSYTWHIV